MICHNTYLNIGKLQVKNAIITNKELGNFFMIDDENIGKIVEAIKLKKYKQICINETDKECNFEKNKKLIQNAFQEILPNKSKFEI